MIGIEGRNHTGDMTRDRSPCEKLDDFIGKGVAVVFQEIVVLRPNKWLEERMSSGGGEEKRKYEKDGEHEAHPDKNTY